MRRRQVNFAALRRVWRRLARPCGLAFCCWLAAITALAEPTGFSNEAELSMAVQFPLILKILQFDRNLASRAGSEIVIAAVYQGRYHASARARDEMLEMAETSTRQRVADLPVRVVDIDLEHVQLEEALDSLGVDVLYVTPLRATDIARITRVTRERHIVSVTGVEEYVRQGVAVGLGVWREKPRVLVNLDASRAEGVDFSSSLLSLAQLVK